MEKLDALPSRQAPEIVSKIFAIQRLVDGSVVSLPPALGQTPIGRSSHLGATVARSINKQKSKQQRQTFFPTEPHHKEEALQMFSTVPLREVTIRPANAAQRFYVKSLQNPLIPYVVGVGPAGTGKTYLAVLAAIQMLRDGSIDKVIITRPTVTSGDEDYGYLPGTLTEKLSPWVIPIIDVFKKFYAIQQVERMIENEVIEIAPFGFMRGRTLENAFIIVDEAQNTTADQMKMVLTRLGSGSRMAITGDVNQFDPTRTVRNTVPGLRDLLRRLNGRPSPAFAVHKFGKGDCVRHPAIEAVLDMYEPDCGQDVEESPVASFVPDFFGQPALEAA